MIAIFVLSIAAWSQPALARGEANWIQSDTGDQTSKQIVIDKRVHRYVGPIGSHSGTQTYLGIEMLSLTAELLDHFGTPGNAGVMISRVQQDSPAQAAGVQVGDIVTAIDSKPVDSPARLAMEIAHRSAGDVVRLEVWRDSELDSIEATLDERDRPRIDIRRLHVGEHAEDVDVRVLQLEVPDHLEEFTAIPSQLEVDPEVFNEALERLNEELADPDWQQRIVRFSEHEHGLQQRIEELEKKLEELERALESLPGDR